MGYNRQKVTMNKNIFISMVISMKNFDVLFLLSVLSFLFLTSHIETQAQQLDGYKNICIMSKGEGYGVVDIVSDFFIEKGFQVITDISNISKDRDERMATIICSYSYETKASIGTFLTMEFHNMLGEKILTLNGHSNGWSTVKHEVRKSTQKCLKSIKSYNYDSSKTPMPPTPQSNKSKWSEEKVKAYFNNNNHNNIEGIYKSIGNLYFKIAILEENGNFLSIVLDTDQKYWSKGDVNAIFKAVKPGYYSVEYYYDNYKKLDTISTIDENGILKIGDFSYMKIYPIN